jgi:hypothetical protein
MRKYQVRFGRGRMEKGAAGYPSLSSQDGPTNPGTSRTSPAAYLTWTCAGSGVAWSATRTASTTRPPPTGA